MSKNFRRLYFAVDHMLSISEYDLENRGMPCQQKYLIKNEVKIPILILFRFCLKKQSSRGLL